MLVKNVFNTYINFVQLKTNANANIEALHANVRNKISKLEK